MLRASALAVAAAMLGSACSVAPGPHGTGNAVFRDYGPGGSYAAGTVPTATIINFSIQPLHNNSGRSVRLLSVRLVSPSGPGIHVTSIRAYLIRQAGMGQLIGLQGDLAHHCGRFMPHPVADVVVAPRSDSNWMVVVAVVFDRPGRYRFGRLRISYVAAGQPGQQSYFMDDFRIVAVSRQAEPQLVDPPVHCRKHSRHS